jgi:hypothetical protein
MSTSNGAAEHVVVTIAAPGAASPPSQAGCAGDIAHLADWPQWRQ